MSFSWSLLFAYLLAQRATVIWDLGKPRPAADVGVVENILGRVLDAFQARMSSLLGGATSKTLAENPQLATLMAQEPSAVQVNLP